MSAAIQIVDEHDNPVGSATKQEAWDKGLWHRVVRIMIEDGKGNLLLQHRTPTKDIYPNCWDNSIAGHVDAGETYDAAANRETEEELGLTSLPLQEIGNYTEEHVWQGRIMNRFVRVYRAQSSATPKSPEPDKIDDVRWWRLDDVKKLIKEHPDQVTDGLSAVIERYY